MEAAVQRLLDDRERQGLPRVLTDLRALAPIAEALRGIEPARTKRSAAA